VATIRGAKEITKHMAPAASYTQQTMQPGRKGRNAGGLGTKWRGEFQVRKEQLLSGREDVCTQGMDRWING